MKPKPRFDSDIASRAERAIAHKALTNSKRPESFIKGVYPTHLKSSKGGYSYDTNGNRYIDFITGLGANLLGACDDEINEAIKSQLQDGCSHSLGHPLEVECAERLKEFFPFVEKWRFLKTGSEACSAALRIARAYKETVMHGQPNIPEWVASDGYHGWHDQFTVLTPPAYGCPDKRAGGGKTMSLEPLGIDSRVHWYGFAGVIIEPIVTDYSDARIEYLRHLRSICTEKKILLIFDEVITGLRWPGYSVAFQYGIIPDLIVLGKALGGGMPLSAVGGKAEVMDTDYFVSSTFAGETLSLAACKKMLDLLQHKHKIDHLWEKGGLFMEKFNAIWPKGIRLEGYPTRSVFKGEKETKDLFFQECCKAGILVGPSFFFSFAHIDLMDEALSTFSDILEQIRLGNVKLEGEPSVVPYAQQVRGKDEPVQKTT